MSAAGLANAGLVMLRLSTSTAQATQLEMEDIPCPVGTGTVRIYTKLAANTDGGYDSDLAQYSTEGQFRAYEISTCVDNFVTLYGDDMRKTLDPDVGQKLLHVVGDLRPHWANPAEPTVWERYDIAGKSYASMNAPDIFLATLYQEASWTLRDEAVGVFIGLNGPLAADAMLQKGAKDLQGTLTAAQRKTLLFNLVRIAIRKGDNALRDQYLAQFEAQGGLDEQERAAVAKLKAAELLEPQYQDLAIGYFEKALASGTLSAADRALATYKLADLYRRRGRVQEAYARYAEALRDDALDPATREMALYLARSQNQGTPPPPAP